MGINRSTARSIIRVIRYEGRIKRMEMGRRISVKNDEEMKAEIPRITDRESFSTVVQICCILRNSQPKKPVMSDALVARTIDGLLLTSKTAGKD